MEASTTIDPTFDQLIQLWETNKLQMPRQYLTKQLNTELNEPQKRQVCDLLQSAMMDVLKLCFSLNWIEYDFHSEKHKPSKPGKYLSKHIDGSISEEHWDGKSWKRPQLIKLTHFTEIPE